MRYILLVLVLCTCPTAVSHAQSDSYERLYNRIERLERENLRLKEEVARLRYERQTQGSYGVPYRGNRSLNDASRSLDDLNRMRNSWDRLIK